MPETLKRGRPRKEDSQKLCRTIYFDLHEEEYMQFLTKFEEFKSLHPKRKSVTKKMFLMSAIQNVSEGCAASGRRAELLQEYAKLKSDFAHIGSNINQLARITNTIGYAHTEEEIADRLGEMNAHLSRVDGISERLLEVMQQLVN